MIPARLSSPPCPSPEMRGSSCHKPVENRDNDNNEDDGCNDYFDDDHDDYFDDDDD